MVVALGPGKFYGSSLPRPRFYTDVKMNEDRVDPPVPVLDPLMSWAEEAHWSMGGVSFQRHRLQGRIEGNVNKLRAEREKTLKEREKKESGQGSVSTVLQTGKSKSKSVVTPHAPVAVKRRRRLVGLFHDGTSEEEEEEERKFKKTARKLGDDFDRVANDKTVNPMKGVGGATEAVAARTRSQKIEKEKTVAERENRMKSKRKNNVESEETVVAKGTRSSPRLARRG